MKVIPMIKLADKDPNNNNTAKRLLESGQPLSIEQIFAIQNAIDIAQQNLSSLQEQLDTHKANIDTKSLASMDPVLVFMNATKKYSYTLSEKQTTKYMVDSEAIFADNDLYAAAAISGYISEVVVNKAITDALKLELLMQNLLH